MEQNISKIKQRIAQYIDIQGISKRKFYNKTGISNGVLDKSTGLTESNIEKYLSAYPEINPDWLLTGRGSMLRSDPVAVAEEPAAEYSRLGIPYVRNAVAWCGQGGVYDGDEYVAGWLDLPGYRDCDAAVGVEGDSMLPHLESGDIVVVQRVGWDSYAPGRMHLVVTREQAQVKYLHPGRDPALLRLLSANPAWPEQQLPAADVIALYAVRGRVTAV